MNQHPQTATRNIALLLTGFLVRNGARPFSWSRDNCCLFAADWAHVLTGTDPAAQFRGGFLSALGAMRIVRDHGGIANIADTMLTAHGWERTDNPKYGDIATTPHERTGSVVGICIDHEVLLKIDIRQAFAAAPIAQVQRAWTWKGGE